MRNFYKLYTYKINHNAGNEFNAINVLTIISIYNAIKHGDFILIS